MSTIFFTSQKLPISKKIVTHLEHLLRNIVSVKLNTAVGHHGRVTGGSVDPWQSPKVHQVRVNKDERAPRGSYPPIRSTPRCLIQMYGDGDWAGGICGDHNK